MAQKNNTPKNPAKNDFPDVSSVWSLDQMSFPSQDAKNARKSSPSTLWIYESQKASEESLPTPNTPFKAEIKLYVAIPPDSGYAWVIVAVAMCINFVIDGIFYSHSKLLLSMSKEFGSTITGVSVLGALQVTVCFFVCVLSTALINRFSLRWVGVVGSLMCAVGFVAAAHLKTYIFVLVFYTFFGGVGLGIVYAITSTVVNYYFERFRVVATTLSSSGTGLGIAVLPAIVHYLLKNHEWNTVLNMYACVCAAMAAMCLLLTDLKPQLVELPENKKVTFDFSSSQNANQRNEEYLHEYPSLNDMVNNPQVSMLEFHQTYQSAKRLMNESQVENLSEKPTNLKVRARPMYRNDIFFNSTLKRLDEYNFFLRNDQHTKKDDPEARRNNLKYHMSVSRAVSIENDVSESTTKNLSPMYRALELLFDFHLWKSKVFFLLAGVGLFFSMGYFIPIYFLKYHALDTGLADDSFLLPVVGVANIIGHIVISALICNYPELSASVICGCITFVGGVITMVSAYPQHELNGDHYVYSFVFGFTIAIFMNVRSLVLVDYLGLEKLTSTYAMLMMVMGIGHLLGSPIAAVVYETTDSYEAAFLYAGVCHVIAGVLLFIVYSIF